MSDQPINRNPEPYYVLNFNSPEQAYLKPAVEKENIVGLLSVSSPFFSSSIRCTASFWLPNLKQEAVGSETGKRSLKNREPF